MESKHLCTPVPGAAAPNGARFGREERESVAAFKPRLSSASTQAPPRRGARQSARTLALVRKSGRHGPNTMVSDAGDGRSRPRLKRALSSRRIFRDGLAAIRRGEESRVDPGCRTGTADQTVRAQNKVVGWLGGGLRFVGRSLTAVARERSSALMRTVRPCAGVHVLFTLSGADQAGGGSWTPLEEASIQEPNVGCMSTRQAVPEARLDEPPVAGLCIGGIEPGSDGIAAALHLTPTSRRPPSAMSFRAPLAFGAYFRRVSLNYNSFQGNIGGGMCVCRRRRTQRTSPASPRPRSQ